MNDIPGAAREILVVGAGMAAQRFVERLLRDPGVDLRVTVIGDEEDGPYDRSALVDLFSGVDAAALHLDRSIFRDDRVRLVRGDRVLRLDPKGRTVRTRSRRIYSYDVLVLATGSYAARVAVDGARLPGCFVLRTIDDVQSVRAFVDARSRALGRPLRAAVIGGGLQGLETATALHGLGVGTSVVQYPDRVMPTQLDASAAAVVHGALEKLGIAVRTRTRTTRLDPDESGSVTALEFQDGSFLRADLVVFTVGVRARDELARNAGLDVHPLGGVIVDDGCGTSDPSILAIGEVARARGERIDSAAPAHAMAEVAAERLLGGEARRLDVGVAAHRRIAGVDVAYFGDALAQGEGTVEVVVHRDPIAGVHRKLVLSDDARVLVGGVLVGDTSAYAALCGMVGASSTGELSAQLWSGDSDRDDDAEVCAHLGMSHRDLRAIVDAAGLSSLRTVEARFGQEQGCERCTLAMTRVLAEIAEVRDPQHAGASPREPELPPLERWHEEKHTVPVAPSAGVLTPAHLVTIGRLAEAFGLHPSVIGDGLELCGVRPEQLGPLCERLAEAGLESGARLPGKGAPAMVSDRGSGYPRRTSSGLRGSPLRVESPA